MSFRAMCFARGEQQSLPGFEENDYAANSNCAARALDSLLAEFDGLRAANIALFASFDAAQLDRAGIANNNPMSVRAIVFILAGHAEHHLRVIKEKYL